MGKKKFILGGLMGVGKTYLINRLSGTEYKAAMDINDESLFIAISQNDNADFTKLIMAKFLDPSNQITDSCLMTHAFTDGLIFKTQSYPKIIERIKSYLDASDINKDDYYIYILEKPWSVNCNNIIQRGRTYELDMLKYNQLTRQHYYEFYNNAKQFYKALGFNNVYLEFSITNSDAPELDFIKYLESNGGIN